MDVCRQCGELFSGDSELCAACEEQSGFEPREYPHREAPPDFYSGWDEYSKEYE